MTDGVGVFVRALQDEYVVVSTCSAGRWMSRTSGGHRIGVLGASPRRSAHSGGRLLRKRANMTSAWFMGALEGLEACNKLLLTACTPKLNDGPVDQQAIANVRMSFHSNYGDWPACDERFIEGLRDTYFTSQD